jgi:hypothetical protein
LFYIFNELILNSNKNNPYIYTNKYFVNLLKNTKKILISPSEFSESILNSYTIFKPYFSELTSKIKNKSEYLDQILDLQTNMFSLIAQLNKVLEPEENDIISELTGIIKESVQFNWNSFWEKTGKLFYSIMFEKVQQVDSLLSKNIDTYTSFVWDDFNSNTDLVLLQLIFQKYYSVDISKLYLLCILEFCGCLDVYTIKFKEIVQNNSLV